MTLMLDLFCFDFKYKLTMTITNNNLIEIVSSLSSFDINLIFVLSSNYYLSKNRSGKIIGLLLYSPRDRVHV